jgi:SulP family sulfate permease
MWQKGKVMTIIQPTSLASLVRSHRTFDLIDVRPEREFERLHIPGARSAPLNKMSAPKILRDRKCPASEPLFVVAENRALGGMAAGILRGAGCNLPVVVDGGMAVWQRQDLPAVHPRRFHFFQRSRK